MTKQEFIANFVLRYTTCDSVVKEYVRPNVNAIITEAKEIWAAIQASEDVDTYRLESLAKKALSRLPSGKYMSQDRDGDWVVFETEPQVYPAGEVWQIGKGNGQCIRFARELPPADFTKRCYRISDILDSE